MNTPISPVIGLVSGLGLSATGQFIDLLAEECRIQYGAWHDRDFPKMLVSSVPLSEGDDADAAFSGGLRQLELAGADFLAVAGDAAMQVPLPAAPGVRVLHPVDLMLEAIPHFAQRVAVVASRSVMASETVQRALWNKHRRQVDPGWQDEVDALLATPPGARRWSGLVARAEAAGVDTILAAGFGLVPAQGIDTVLHVVDAAQCLARGIIAEWLAWCVED